MDNFRPSSLPESLPSLHVPGFERMTFGQRAAETVTKVVGSWRFIICQSVMLLGWLLYNSLSSSTHWDPYPFILMNLLLSLQAAYTAPMIMMAQNRAADADRYLSKSSYFVSAKTDIDVQDLRELLLQQKEQITELRNLVEDRK